MSPLNASFLMSLTTTKQSQHQATFATGSDKLCEGEAQTTWIYLSLTINRARVKVATGNLNLIVLFGRNPLQVER